MNKKILMAAIGAALVAVPMMAVQAAAPTVYGKLNVGFARIDSGNSSNGDTFAVTDNASRLGVKGDEDLGGGLKSIYMFETAIDGDNGGYGSARDVFVGLQGSNWGSVRLGQYNSIYKNLSTGLEVFADTIGDFTTLGLNGETREANQISYSSPNMSGFEVGIASVRGETGLSTTTTTAGESNPLIVAFSFKSGPLYLGLGRKDMDNQSATPKSGLDDSMKFVAGYQMDPLALWAVLEKQSVAGTKSATNQEIDTRHIGLSYKLANNTFALTFTDAKSSQTNFSAKQTTLGVIHALSKSTAIKTLYTKIDNDSLASRSGSMLSATSLTATAAGKDPTGLEVQLSVSF